MAVAFVVTAIEVFLTYLRNSNEMGARADYKPKGRPLNRTALAVIAYVTRGSEEKWSDANA